MRRVVVVGSSNTDMTVRVPVLPAAGQTVLGDSFVTTPGGKGANQAVAARRAGAEVVFVAAVGDDDLGRQAVERYRREGINVDHIRTVEEVSSGVALIFVSHDGENMIGVASGANQRLNPTDIDRLPDSLFRAGDLLLAGLEIPIPTAIRAMRRGKSSGMTVILNPAPLPRSRRKKSSCCSRWLTSSLPIASRRSCWRESGRVKGRNPRRVPGDCSSWDPGQS